MGRKSQTAQSAQNGQAERSEQGNQQVENILSREAVPGSTQDAPKATQEVADPEELLRCQGDGAEAGPMDGQGTMELADGVFLPYAVTAAGRLRLRQEPRLDAPIIAELPCGAGVYAEGQAVNGWLHVRTGRLEGFMMARYLEVLPLPELHHVFK